MQRLGLLDRVVDRGDEHVARERSDDVDPLAGRVDRIEVVGEPDALLGTGQGQIARSGHTQLLTVVDPAASSASLT